MRVGPAGTFNPFSLLFGAVGPVAASESAGDITVDAANGSALYFTHTLAGAEELQAPLNLPEGGTMTLEVDPDGQTLTFAAAFQAPTPTVTRLSTLQIQRISDAAGPAARYTVTKNWEVPE
jgi:hypothetical protein